MPLDVYYAMQGLPKMSPVDGLLFAVLFVAVVAFFWVKEVRR